MHPWPPPPGPPPVTPPPAPAANDPRVPVGVVAMVVACFLLLLAARRMLAALLAAALDEAQRHFLPGAVPTELADAAGALAATLRRIATLQAVSLSPIMLAAMALIVAGVFLVGKHRLALGVTQGWCALSLFAIGASGVVQALYLLPALQGAEERLCAAMTTSPCKVESVVPTMGQTVMPLVLLGGWTAFLYGWAWYASRPKPPDTHMVA